MDQIRIPLDAWYHDDTGAAIIDTDLGERLWTRAREIRDAKAAAARDSAAIDQQLRAIIGDGSGLITLDGRPIAMLTKSIRRTLDKDRVAKVSGLDLTRFMVEHEVISLEIAAALQPRG